MGILTWFSSGSVHEQHVLLLSRTSPWMRAKARGTHYVIGFLSSPISAAVIILGLDGGIHFVIYPVSFSRTWPAYTSSIYDASTTFGGMIERVLSKDHQGESIAKLRAA